MILVLLVALGIVGSGMVRRAIKSHRLAAQSAIAEAHYREAEALAFDEAQSQQPTTQLSPGSKAMSGIEAWRDLAAWAKVRKEKYQHAAAHPWEPDPGELPFRRGYSKQRP